MNDVFYNYYPELECLGSALQFNEEIFEIVDKIKVLENFTIDEINELCKHMTCYGAPTDVKILCEGDLGEYMVILLTGKVAVMKRTDSGDDVQLSVAVPGTSLGEMSLIDGKPRFANCVTLMPSDFAVLDRHNLNAILTHTPRLGNKLLLELLQITTERLRETTCHYIQQPSI